MEAYTTAYIKRLPTGTIKRMLREAGYTQRDVARYHGCSHVNVNRVIRKQMTSDPVWKSLVFLLNRPKREVAEPAQV
jgi:hypothetical protein